MPSFKSFKFTSSTGKNKIFARICLPDGKPRGVVQIAHGIAEHIGRYEEFMRFLASNGFVCAGNDHLGHGRSIAEPSERGFFAEDNGWLHVVADMERLHRIVSKKYPDIPYNFFGHSMGSFLTRTYLIRYPDAADRAVICGTGQPPAAVSAMGWCIADSAAKAKGPRYVSKGLNDFVFGSYSSAYDMPRTEYDWLSRDDETVDRYIADPLCGFIPSVGLFRDMMSGIVYISDPANTAKMNKELPVLFISGTADPVGEYSKGVVRSCSSFLSAGMTDVRLKLYSGARHELINELNKKQVMSDVLSFLTEN